ncbi:MAG: OmpA family protein [Rhodospirillales bacterium]|jgi:OmpA-OmpF porin, OOP family|nr:OmpA family protein [Rhodospirillales bacterium]MBT4038588.1 OmpA family protein [Rhodospirillales bacterium]MBT4627239.1 OmpA family protein [Rhodospirillales bacterium]MBT5351571.1 OmpA family protein [Rhodospirillales bacterium]MBT5521215.1 OmpA family protein [Rhodospirillales bacterium]
MKMIKKLSGIVLTLPILAACANYDMDTVGNMEISSWEFAESLHGQYMRIGRDEAAEQDWSDAIFFRNKAREAAEAANEGAALPDPQMVSDRDIPDEALADLNAAYDSLMAALEDGRRTKPTAAAIAQTSFDCWLQEQEENVQPDDIALCRDDFEDALALLLKTSAPMAAVAPAAADAMATAGPFMIYFGFNSASLDSSAKSLIMNLAAHKFAKDEMGYIVLTGHADLSGGESYNDALSERRVMAVESALNSSGVSARILSSSYGESRPLKATSDGMREAKNRRVEVTLSQ